MIPIRLHLVGWWTQDIDVHAIPTKGSEFHYHGCSSTESRLGVIEVTGIVRQVIFTAGHKWTVAAIVIVDTRVKLELPSLAP